MTEVSAPLGQPSKARVQPCLLAGWKGPTAPRPDVPKLSAQPVTCPEVSGSHHPLHTSQDLVQPEHQTRLRACVRPCHLCRSAPRPFSQQSLLKRFARFSCVAQSLRVSSAPRGCRARSSVGLGGIRAAAGRRAAARSRPAHTEILREGLRYEHDSGHGNGDRVRIT